METRMLPLTEEEQVFERAVAGFRALGDLRGVGDAMVRFATLVWLRGDVVRALGLCKEAVAILEREPAGPELANAYSRLSFRLAVAGDAPGALAMADSALELARELNLPMEIQSALQSRGIARVDAGDLGGLEDLREALRMCLELGAVHEIQSAYMNLGDDVWVTEGPRAAIALHREAIDQWERRGMGFNDWATGELCWILFDAGDWEALTESAAAVLEFEARTKERRQPGAMALTMRSLVQLHRGHAEPSAAVVPEILERVRGSDAQVQIPGLAVCTLIQLRRGNHDETIQLLSELAEACRKGPQGIRHWFLPDIARIATSVGRPEIARELCESIGDIPTRSALSLFSARAVLAEADGLIGEAAAMHAEAADGWRAYGNIPEQGFSLLSEGRCLLQLGRDTEADRALGDARGVFASLQVSTYIAEIDELLRHATA